MHICFAVARGQAHPYLLLSCRMDVGGEFTIAPPRALKNQRSRDSICIQDHRPGFIGRCGRALQMFTWLDFEDAIGTSA
jgi:hypothetical protein